MLLSRSFVLGLLAYLRQAALSLHRAPVSFSKAMHDYYDAHMIPGPGRVVARIDAIAQAGKTARELTARVSGSAITFSAEDLSAVRDALRALETALEMRAVESDTEKIRIRLLLSEAEELVRQKLGRQAGQVEKIEHLNQTSGLGLRPLGELVGSGWPESD